MLNLQFLDSKRRPKFTTAIVCLPNIQKLASNLEDRKPEVQALPEMLDSRLRQRGSCEGSHAKRKEKLVAVFLYLTIIEPGSERKALQRVNTKTGYQKQLEINGKYVPGLILVSSHQIVQPHGI